MKKLFLAAFAVFTYQAFSQSTGIAINESHNSANASAMLDISSDTKGMLIPRMALTSTTSNSPIGSGIATSLLIYNTATTGDVAPGFYFWNGSVWKRLSASTENWNMDGNSNGAVKYIGTNDNYDLPFYTNGSQKAILTTDGFMGIGTSSHLFAWSEKLSVNGAIGIPASSPIFYGSVGSFIAGEPGLISGDANTLYISSESGSAVYYVNGNSNNAAHYFQTVANGQGTIYTRMFIGNDGKVGIGTTSPAGRLTIVGATGYDQLNMNASYTPSSTSDSNGHTGDIAWDDNYVYIKTSSGWKRASLGTF